MRLYKIMVGILFICSLSFSANLDSLLDLSKIGEQKSRSLGGFLLSRQTINSEKFTPIDRTRLTPPSILFRNIAPSNNSNVPGSDVVNYRLSKLESELENLKTSQEKITAILDNLQKQSDSHTSNVSLITKIFEIICGTFSSIFIAYMGMKLKKKI